MFGINGGEAIILLLIAVLVIGPERLPAYAEQLARWVRAARATVSATRDRVATELGEDVDWASLDPRRYDPRWIVRDALLDPEQPSARRPGGFRTADGPAPFDDEAT